MNVLKTMPMRGRITLGATLFVTLIVAFVLFRMATAPAYETMISGIDPGKTQKVTLALDEAGIPYKLENNGTALAVEKSSQAQARVALAAAGVETGTGDKPGFELLDNQKLGSSDFQQKVNYQRALEGEIGNTIGGIAGVSSAQVQLSLPEDQLFADETKAATAAVLLGSSNDGLDPQQVRGIANLVASSVEGLKNENVTITSSDGQMLWPVSEDGGGATTKLAAENRYAAQLEGSLNAMLIRTLGVDKARVQVKATMNVDEVSREELKYGTKITPLTSKTEKESLESDGAGGAASGARANIDGVTQAATGGTSDYQRDAEETANGVDKTVQRTKVAPGTVERQSVALVLDKGSVPAATVGEIEKAVGAAAGIDVERGDTLSVSQVAFDKPKAAEAKGSPVPPQALGAAKWVGLGIASILFLFFVTRALRKREAEALGNARWLTEIEEPRPLAALTAAAAPVSGGHEPVVLSAARTEVDAMVANEPEKVAQQLKAWMAEDE